MLNFGMEVNRMTYAQTVELDELTPYVKEKLGGLQYGQKGKLAEHLGVSLAQLSHYLTGARPVPQKYVPGILAFFGERANVQIIRDADGAVIVE